MAAYFKKAKSLYASTANTFGTGTSVTITPASVSGLPTDTEITLTFDRIDASGTATPNAMERIIGTISGGNFVVRTSPSTGRGADGTSDAAHTSPVVEYIYNAKDHNDTIDGILIGHEQTGIHKSGATYPAPSITGDANLEATGNIQVASADPKRTMYVPASAMFPSSTAGCAALTQVESSSNKVNIKVLDFDGAGTSKESAEFGIQSPSYWDASTVTAQFIWYASAGSGTVNFELQGGAFSDDDALDAAYGTLQEVTDTLTAIGDVMISAETSAITIAGTPVAGDWLNFRVNRDPANDTNTSDARLMGIRIRFGVAKYNDA